MNQPQLKLKTDALLISNSVPTSRVLEIEFTAPQATHERAATPLNLSLVIDRSGSMGGGKLEQAKLAVRQILDLLRPCDSLAVVAFDDQVNTVGEISSVTPSARATLLDAINRLHTGGSTNLGAGWLQGCECVARWMSDGRVNRTLLLTDGQANQGVTGIDELGNHAAALFERGVSTSTFGIGFDFNEHLLEAMANRGGGNYYYIDHDQRIPQLLMEEFKDLAAVTARKVVLEVNFPSNVSVELLGDWRSELRDGKLVINLSDLPAGRSVNLFLKVLTPPGSGQLVMNTIALGLDEEDRQFQVAEEISLQYASADKVAAAEATRDVDLATRFATVAMGQFSNQALKLEREGRFEEAGKLMDKLMLEYGGNMPAPTRDRYERVRREVREGLDEPRRKEYNQDSYLLKKHRHNDQMHDPNQQ